MKLDIDKKTHTITIKCKTKAESKWVIESLIIGFKAMHKAILDALGKKLKEELE